MPTTLSSVKNDAALGSLPTIVESEKYAAAGMHVASIFFPLIAPATVYALYAGRSRYVKAHAYQALFETIALNVAVFVVGAISLTYTIIRLWDFYQHDWAGFSIWPLLARFAIGWILFTLLEFANTVVSIMQAYHALRGDWPRREIRKSR